MRVDDLIGVPFEDGGRGPDGYDCWGLVYEVYKRNGIELPDYKLACHDYEGSQRAFYKEIKSRVRHDRADENIPVPAVVAIRFNSPFVNHVGVYIGDGKFLHTREKTGVVIERVESPYWQHRIEGFYTHE